MKSRNMRWAAHVACMGEMRNFYKILVRKPEGKKPLERPRHTWKDNIQMDLKKIGCESADWIHVAQNRKDKLWQALVNMVMNLSVLGIS
jgi:hypothetical protein